MSLIGVNILVNAFHRDSTKHAICADWLSRLIGSPGLRHSDSNCGIPTPYNFNWLNGTVTDPKVPDDASRTTTRNCVACGSFVTSLW